MHEHAESNQSEAHAPDEFEFVDAPLVDPGTSGDAAGDGGIDSGTLAPDDMARSSDEPRDSDSDDPDRVPELAGLSEDPPASLLASFSMPEVGAHLDELRRRLFIALGIFVPLFVLGIVLYRPLWALVTRPLERAAPHLLRFQALGPSDGLVMTMRIAFAFALFLALPVILAQAWAFVSPGLTTHEKRLLYLSLGSGGVLFVLGAAACYFVGLPLALGFLLPFNQTLPGWENAFTGAAYVDFVITCCAGFGLAFELPLVMLALGLAGILTSEAIRAHWRAVVLGIFLLAAIMTPPDPFTLILLATPMLALFGVGYVLVKTVAEGKTINK